MRLKQILGRFWFNAKNNLHFGKSHVYDWFSLSWVNPMLSHPIPSKSHATLKDLTEMFNSWPIVPTDAY